QAYPERMEGGRKGARRKTAAALGRVFQTEQPDFLPLQAHTQSRTHDASPRGDAEDRDHRGRVEEDVPSADQLCHHHPRQSNSGGMEKTSCSQTQRSKSSGEVIPVFHGHYLRESFS